VEAASLMGKLLENYWLDMSLNSALIALKVIPGIAIAFLS